MDPPGGSRGSLVVRRLRSRVEASVSVIGLSNWSPSCEFLRERRPDSLSWVESRTEKIAASALLCTAACDCIDPRRAPLYRCVSGLSVADGARSTFLVPSTNEPRRLEPTRGAPPDVPHALFRRDRVKPACVGALPLATASVRSTLARRTVVRAVSVSVSVLRIEQRLDRVPVDEQKDARRGRLPTPGRFSSCSRSPPGPNIATGLPPAYSLSICSSSSSPPIGLCRRPPRLRSPGTDPSQKLARRGRGGGGCEAGVLSFGAPVPVHASSHVVLSIALHLRDSCSPSTITLEPPTPHGVLTAFAAASTLTVGALT